MTTTAEDHDLAFLKRVAERGASAPLLGGRFLLFWGVMVMLADLAHYAVLKGMIGNGPAALGIVWSVFGVVGVAGSTVLGRTFPTKAGAGTVGNLVERDVWRMVGIATGFYVGGAVAAISLGGVGPILMDTIQGVAFLLYAVAFAATGRAADVVWFRWASFLSLLLGTGALTLVGNPNLYLLGAAGVFVVAVVPGALLLMREPPVAATDE
ncbi:MAG: hypothetical protein V2I43_18365 [Parvularcula sp.]|jgi:hypothetical protein|nr:hypothetical protein [Parvularcula sp.]